MTGEQLVSRQSAQVPCQTKSQAAEQITFSNRQLRVASISLKNLFISRMLEWRWPVVIDHPILVFYEAFFGHNRAAEIAGLPPRLTSFRIISSEEKKKYFWYNNTIFRPCWSILGPIWSILSNADTPFLARFGEICPPNSPLCLHLFPSRRQGYHNICYVILIFRISIQSHYYTCNVSIWIFQILFGSTT